MHKLKIVTITAVGIITLFYAGSVVLPVPDDYAKIGNGLKLFGQVYKQVSTTYVDEIDPETFVHAAIRGMLRTLDPYTSFVPPKNSADINMLTSGKYGGVGIKLGIRGDSLTVISPMEGTPAGRSGILAGDKIIKIDSVNSKGLKLDEAADLIRGPKGNKVALTITRLGLSGSLEFTLVRETIEINEVIYSGLIKEGLGYIRLTGFSKSSISKFKKSLVELRDVGISGLIVDLRDNPGGLLESALKISDMFIEKDQLLVSTRGRIRQMNREHYSTTDPIIDKNVELVVLVNGGSASASEIFAGVMQDLDRGIVIGRKTFGKGLVQSILNLDYDNKIKITTGKYYIPSGRLIQREDYFNDSEDVVIREFQDTLFVTSNGRPVYGKGGITPDIVVQYPSTSRVITDLWRKGMFYRYSGKWMTNNHNAEAPILASDKDVEDFIDFARESGFEYKNDVSKAHEKFIIALESAEYSDQLINKIKDVKSEFHKFEEEFKTDEKDVIKRILSREISERIGNTKGRYKALFLTDRAILRSIDVLEDNLMYKQTLGVID